MALTDDLNTASEASQAMNAVFEIRAAAQNLYNALVTTAATIDRITAEPRWAAGVNATVRQTCNQLRTKIDNAKVAFDEYAEFLNWIQP